MKNNKHDDDPNFDDDNVSLHINFTKLSSCDFYIIDIINAPH